MKRIIAYLLAILLVLFLTALIVCATESEETQSEASIEDTTREISAYEKFFEVFSLVVMSIGLFGLPVYFVLNSRRNKLIKEQEYSEDNEEE